MSIYFVTGDSPYCRYLANAVAPHVDKVLVEFSAVPMSFYRKKLKRVGYVNFIFQAGLKACYNIYGHYALGRPKQILARQPIANINEVDFLKPDDVLYCFGTGIVKKKTIDSVNGRIFNIHTGILPYYRGVKTEFWAIKNKDYNNIGWTLHFMTPKLDQGYIVRREPINSVWGPIKTRIIIVKNIALSLPYNIGLFKNYFPYNTPGNHKGPYYTTPTLKEWCSNREHINNVDKEN